MILWWIDFCLRLPIGWSVSSVISFSFTVVIVLDFLDLKIVISLLSGDADSLIEIIFYRFV